MNIRKDDWWTLWWNNTGKTVGTGSCTRCPNNLEIRKLGAAETDKQKIIREKSYTKAVQRMPEIHSGELCCLFVAEARCSRLSVGTIESWLAWSMRHYLIATWRKRRGNLISIAACSTTQNGDHRIQHFGSIYLTRNLFCHYRNVYAPRCVHYRAFTLCRTSRSRFLPPFHCLHHQ